MADLVKTVTMRILADAGDAQAKLDELTARADALGADTIRLNVRVDAPDLATLDAKLAATRAMLADKGLTEAGIRIRVDGAGAAIAELTAVKRAEDDLGGGGSLLSKLGGLLGKFPGGDLPLGPLGTLPIAGGLPGIGAVAAVAAAAAAALPVIASLVSGFVAAGAGAVAFGALAYPELAKISAGGTTAAAGIAKLSTEYGKLTKAFAPTALSIINDALKVANDMLPHVVPLASAFANALGPLLQQLDKFAQSKGFQDWIQQFSKLIGPAVTAIGQGAGQIAIAFGKILTSVNPKDVGTAIHVLADVIVGALKVIPPAIHAVMDTWHDLQTAGETVARYLVSVWNSFESAVAADLHAAGDVVHAVEAAWQSLVSSAESVYHGVMSAWESMIAFLESLPGKIEAVFASAGSWLVSAGVAILQGLLNGLESMAGTVLSWISNLGSSILNALGGILHIGSPSRATYAMGRWMGEGLALGIGDSLPTVLAASRQMGAAALGGLAATRGGGYGGGNVYVTNEFHGITTDQNTVRQVVQAIQEYKRHGGGAALGIA